MSDHFRVLGIHDNHNASVSLLEDGAIVFSLQEERLNGIKNFNGFPSRAVHRALDFAQITLDDIDLFAFGTVHNPAWKDTAAQIRQYSAPTWKKYLADGFKASPFFSLYTAKRARQRQKFLATQGIPADRTRFYDHNLTHAATALCCSGFYGTPALILALDGGGDGNCAGVYTSRDGDLAKVAVTKEGNSVGNLYAVSTFYMGMMPLEHEYKLMGMAPYSQPKYYEGMSRALDHILSVDGLTFRRSTVATTSNSFRALEAIYRRQRFDAVCAALQDFTERSVTRWVQNAIAATGLHRICLSGGVFMNVKLNKLIASLPGVEELFVMPSCGDESNAMGAAFLAYKEHCAALGTDPVIHPLSHLYLGEAFGDETIRSECRNAGYTFEKDGNINRFVAEMLNQNRIVARCSGRSEWGARALGNRSILANPKSFETVSKINDAIKMRDFWMPFAGSVMEEAAGRYLVNPRKIPSPYMMLAFDTTRERESIRAATHPRDRTIRPQILPREQNPDYHAIISEFSRMTGTGCVLNTSFNLHGSPMVYHPREALETLTKSDLDILVMGDYVIRKET
ncbi:carbamoyltransferase C-terminal domain-containing protein [Methanoregula formicica]|uniref:Putative carbamoyl transferase, NodU family n=1 Tax=Methanoregula formicica (strain DSM 22288 / NBRC 105244 / SMSP) TaxID=593750 RepID=L0HEK1_METFS|nr:carbamoyltransferase C-terminal domain-containing protein [Methanoregula formicica]AGB02191.1 putative carbamoyl transferase, NodU family [Methanoregula formicica SMSP]